MLQSNEKLMGDIIFVEDVIGLFGNKITKKVVYNMIREKRLPALKAGKRYLFSRKKVESIILKKLGQLDIGGDNGCPPLFYV